MSNPMLSLRVASRYQRQVLAAFLSDKWFKQKKGELNGILKQSLGNDDPTTWGWILTNQVVPFFNEFLADFNRIVSLDIARRSIRDRVESFTSYIEAIANKLPNSEHADFDDPKQYLQWYAKEAIFKKMATQAKTVGDLFKYTWTINQGVLDRLVQRTLRAGTPEEIDSLTNDRRYTVKYQFLDRVKFEAGALKALSKGKLDNDPTKWVDRIYEMLKANYSESALQEQGYFQEFSLHGIKVVVDDRTVDASDIQKYVRFLSEAYARLRNKGFEDAWYGTVFIQCRECGGVNPNTGGETGGWYEIGPDTVTIFVRPAPFVVELMVHELGHRYWFKSMQSSQRRHFEALVKTYTKPRPNMPASAKLYTNRDIREFRAPLFEAKRYIDSVIERVTKYNVTNLTPLARKGVLEDGQLFVDDIAKAMKPKAVDANLGPELRDLERKVDQTRNEVTRHFDSFQSVATPEEQSEWVAKAKDLVARIIKEAGTYVGDAITAQNRKILDENPEAREWLESLQKNPAPVPAVSDYGKSNIDEAFAEVFAHYVLGYDITQDQAESFRAVLKTASLTTELTAFFDHLAMSRRIASSYQRST